MIGNRMVEALTLEFTLGDGSAESLEGTLGEVDGLLVIAGRALV